MNRYSIEIGRVKATVPNFYNWKLNTDDNPEFKKTTEINRCENILPD